MPNPSPSPQQRQTEKARQTFRESFDSEDAHRAHMRELGERSAANRLILSADDRHALGEAYRLLERIYQRHQAKLDAESESAG